MKLLIQVMIFVLALNLAFWLFNHVNPWIGIGSVLTILIISYYLITKQKKKNETV